MNNSQNNSVSPLIKGVEIDVESVGLVIPAYREGENIVRLIAAIFEVLPSIKIVVVDDSPDDLSANAIEAFFATDKKTPPQLHYIHRNQKGGRGSAVIDGLKKLLELGCNILLEMDADFSHPPMQLTQLLNVLREKNADLVIASRYLPESKIFDWPLSRRVFSKCANLLSRIVLQIPISDYTNGYRCYSLRAAKLIVGKCGIIGKGFISLSEILVTLNSAGYSIYEVSTVFVNRVRGESSLNFVELKNAILGIFQIKLLQISLRNKISSKEAL